METTMLQRLLQVPTYAALGIVAVLAGCPAPGTPTSSGYEIKTAGITVVAGNTGVTEALCSSGKKALGGGFKIGGGILIAGPDIAVYESSPRVTSGTDGWRLEAANRGTTARSFDVWVICAKM
jgi:hypothetical protein